MAASPDYVGRAGLRVAAPLARFVEQEALAGLHIEPNAWWEGAAAIFARFTDENRRLLTKRDALQQQIDAYHGAHRGAASGMAAYRTFLGEIGYLAPEPEPFTISVTNVDDEVARTAGPQLVVPALNRRFALNAANARWGSLYDALYGSDAVAPPDPAVHGYDPTRGAQVVAWAKAFLDMAVPLAHDVHANVTEWRVAGGEVFPRLCDPSAFRGYRGAPEAPCAILLRHNGLGVELHIDRSHAVGRDDPAGLADIVLESALTTIVDLEDSIAAVDAEDKTNAYRTWLGLMKGDLSVQFEKDGKMQTRSLAPDRAWTTPGGGELSLPGRSLLFVRNVGCHMMTDAVLLQDGAQTPEGVLDAIVTSTIALHDLRGLGKHRNSAAGSIYIVKPKLHGPEEASFSDRIFDAVEDLLGLERCTLKIGLMDEERRTSCNLAASIHAVRRRIVFINTGFLDRTGDEIHTSMRAGPMVAKTAMKTTDWIDAYEKRNVSAGLACGFAGMAQIGKGMWAAPDRMADMLAQKIAHPTAGATTAWAPSPTAATLHATHYHKIDVFERQGRIAAAEAPSLERLLTIPLMSPSDRLSPEEIARELDNNTQGILGYVVRWIDQGIGCSKVPDIENIGLMEDRATLRISSQHLANWLLHGVCSAADIDASFLRMAARVDAQNSDDPLYRPLASEPEANLAFQAARALVHEGLSQPNGYTEAVLHAFRKRSKIRTA